MATCRAAVHMRAITTALLALTISAMPTGPASAGGTLTVGMTAGDIPVTTGNPDQGFEGYRFVGYNLYDGLLLWDLSKSDKPSEPKPGLATSYEIDPSKQKRWIVHLRQGVTWHDGCKFTADDVVYSFEALKTKGHPIFAQSLQDVVKAEAIDPHTVRYTFKGTLTRDLPLTVAGLPIVSKTYYANRDFAATNCFDRSDHAAVAAEEPVGERDNADVRRRRR